MLIQTQAAVDYASSLSSALTPRSFYEAYCWVVYSCAIGESKLMAIWPDLARIYQNFDPYTVNKDIATELEEWVDPKIALGPSQCALMIQLFGWEQFYQQFIKTSDPKRTLATLRGLDWLNVQRLGHLLNMEWANSVS
ncbi:MAG: hypothetical protein WCA07_02250 [Gloeobacterales cyanobacterium]